jgi:hypothetical protein
VSFTGFVSRINRHVQARRRRASRIETDDWMLAAPALSVVDRLARMEQPELVLELGSGRSTIVLADAVASYGGRLVSLEHDPRYYRRTQEWLGSRANVELRLAPIRSGWYACSGWDDLQGIGLLIVDGPPNPEDDQRNTRAPALESLGDRLEADATIVVDDTQRDKESDMVRRWIDAYGLRVVEVLDHPGGDELTVLRRGHA